MGTVYSKFASAFMKAKMRVSIPVFFPFPRLFLLLMLESGFIRRRTLFQIKSSYIPIRNTQSLQVHL